jgi:hypothetical protein
MAQGLKVFILGPPRSGTSAIYFAMQEILGLPGEGESHVLPVYQRVVHAFARYCEEFAVTKGVLANRLNSQSFRAHVLEHLRAFYDKTFPHGSFVDKTPGAEAIMGAILIRDAFPDSRIIVTRRTGIEVVQSHRRKFSTNFVEACRAWSTSMEAIRRVRAFNKDIFEIEHFDLANSPDRICEQLAIYLGCGERGPTLGAFLKAHRTDQHSDHDWSNRLLLATVGWSDQEKQTFCENCGEQMGQFGYPM